VYEFKVASFTIANVYAWKHVCVSISDPCTATDQIITPVDPEPLVLEYIKHNGVQMMLDEDAVEDLFQYNNSKRCLAIEYEIYSADGSVIDSEDDLFSVLLLGQRDNFSISLDTDSAPQDGTVVELSYPFKIKAINAGGAFGWKDVEFKIIICGYETLDAATLATQDYTVFIVNAEFAEAENKLLSDFYTTNDTDCPAISYTTLISFGRDGEVIPSQQQSFNFKIYQNLTSIYLQLYPQTQGIYYFFVKGESVTNQPAYKYFNLSIECGEISQTLTLVDNEVQVLDALKNEGRVTLMNSQLVQALFDREEPTRCPIETY